VRVRRWFVECDIGEGEWWPMTRTGWLLRCSAERFVESVAWHQRVMYGRRREMRVVRRAS